MIDVASVTLNMLTGDNTRVNLKITRNVSLCILLLLVTCPK